jgi:hypothetical protein
MRVILNARVGSHLYGLDTPESDEDYLGIFVTPTYDILRLRKPTQTHVTKDPDTTLHEVEKFMYLAAKGNPTVLELLYSPEYLYITWEGEMLVAARDAFLSNNVRNSFGGYAYQQAVNLQKRTNEGKVGFNPKVTKHYEKHARHCFRLLRQGKELIETGTLNPRLENPDEYFAIGKLSEKDLVSKFTEEYNAFKEAKSVLPDEPNWEFLDSILNEIRSPN